MESMSGDLMDRLKERRSKMSSSQKAIASYILEHYDQAAFMTAAKIGEAVGTSESTVVRFAISLGYKGYPEFRQALSGWVRNRINSVSRMAFKFGDGDSKNIINEVLTADIERIRDTIDIVRPDVFEASCNLILEAEHVYVSGLRSAEPLASFLSFYLNIIRNDVIQLRSTSTSEIFEQELRISPDDVLIGICFPRYSMRTLKTMELARDNGARVISITDGPYSPMNMYSTFSLYARSDSISITDSMVAPLSLLNAIITGLCLKRPEQVRENLEKLEKAWRDYQVYLNDEIDFMNGTTVLDYSLFRNEEG
ncbi:MAG: MurR/RpiR family transcriptional regulator [Lachnospiraceae bacterium]|nr:MurR/RpiR family transcriptional regulator [Lachnospiraceae bacterium]